LRVIYFRCAGRERDHGEENLRPLSTDYVGFIYDWSAGKPLTEIQPPAGVEFGDAIKALQHAASGGERGRRAATSSELDAARQATAGARPDHADIMLANT
jgi:hypothetical protein